MHVAKSKSSEKPKQAKSIESEDLNARDAGEKAGLRANGVGSEGVKRTSDCCSQTGCVLQQ